MGISLDLPRPSVARAIYVALVLVILPLNFGTVAWILANMGDGIWGYSVRDSVVVGFWFGFALAGYFIIRMYTYPRWNGPTLAGTAQVLKRVFSRLYIRHG